MRRISTKNKTEWEGKRCKSKECDDFIVKEYKDTFHVLIEFVDYPFQHETSLSNIKRGSVGNPMFPSVYGVAYFGIGPYKLREGINPQFKCYKIWKEMIGRCYFPTVTSYPNYGAKGITVCDEWLNYQNYAKWYEENCLDLTFVVDKDILHKGSKQYSPENCCFVPQDINACFTKREIERGYLPIGVRAYKDKYQVQINYMGKKKYLGMYNTPELAFEAYKIAKEQCIKEYAEMYKDKITPIVYEALLNYKVEITD